MGVLKGITTCLILLVLALPIGAAEKLDAEIAFEESQAAIGNLTGGHMLKDHRGRDLALDDFRGKPLVVSLIYTSCGTVCPIVTNHLRDSVAETRRVLGPGRFNVLTFGFDASGDRPGQLSGFAGTHRLLGIDDWLVASADEGTTETMLAELGFAYREAAGGIAHVTQTSILDAEGRVYRQLYGEQFPLPMLLEPLKDLTLGRTTRSVAPADLWDRLTFLCTVYNPLTGAYRFDYSIFFGIFFGGFSLLIFAWVILRLILERRKALRAERPPPHSPGAA
ncbi:MAG: SCO family protein [Planctomycetota bacterium]|nr:SCO family protein [Planctomycetota bacterium]